VPTDTITADATARRVNEALDIIIPRINEEKKKYYLQIIIKPSYFHTNICISATCKKNQTRVENSDMFLIDKH
jgi:hypothetical protein